jgi:DNA-binding NtrC family response regulator
MRNDINDLKRMMTEALSGRSTTPQPPQREQHEIAGLLPERHEEIAPRYEYEDMVEVVDDDLPKELTKEDVQREQIIQALQHNNYRRKEAARDLFISERTLYRRMKALGIDDNTK